MLDTKYKIKVLPYFGEVERIEEWTLECILEEINRDRSNEWTNYDETDWREGWNEWVEGEYYSLIDKFMVGDIVETKNENNFKLHCSTIIYDSAVVVSLEPFTLVSKCTSMKWVSTVKKEYFNVVGKADKNILQRCKGRIDK